MIDLGIVKPGSTIRIPFSTFDSNDPQASATITGFAVADIRIYKDGGTTERASTAGFTATTDFDTLTGIHLVVIDLSDNTTAGFYAAGSEYIIAVADVTLDAATVRKAVARFEIGYPDAVLNTTIATLSTQTSFTLTDGPAENDALNGWTVIIHDVASDVQLGHAVVSDYVGATKTVTLTAGTSFTAAATDNISLFLPANVNWVQSTAQTANDNGADINTLLTRIVGTLAAGTHNAQGGDNFARLGAPAGASVSADIAAIKAETALIVADTNELQTDDVPGLIAALNDVSTAEVNTQVDTALSDIGLDHLVSAAVIGADITDNSIIARLASKSATADWDSYDNTTDSLEAIADSGGGGPTAAQIADAVWDEPKADHTTSTTFGDLATDLDSVLTDTADMQPKLGTPAADISADIAAIKSETALIVADTNELQTDDIPGLIAALNDIAAGDVWAVDATTQQTQGTFGQAIGDPVADTTTIYQAVATDAAGDNVSIDVIAVKAETASIQADTTNIETDTQDIQSRLPAALVNSRMDATIDATGFEDDAVDKVWDELMAGHTTSDSAGEVMNDWQNGGRLDLILDIIAEDTTTDIPALITALNDLSAAQVNAEMVDALATDTYAEPGQGNPAATTTIAAKINYLYKWTRNQKDNDGSTTQFYADNGTTVDQKQTTSEAAGTVTKGEIVTGP